MAAPDTKYKEAIKDPLIELLAIKLFEHDADYKGNDPISLSTGWMTMCSEDREAYRNMARGSDRIGIEQE